MEKSKSFTGLIVWQKVHALALVSYQIIQGFPKEEVFGITSQTRRASVSVAANIAEGFKRRSANDKARCFNNSEGSLDETKYFLILSKDLGSIEDNVELINKTDEVAKLLYSYKNAILNSIS